MSISTTPEDKHSGQWRLSRLEVVNWGTFGGLHRIDVAREGHLFTGASGSGKSSLLDAIAAVLTPDQWLRFNAAAQDAGSKGDDRGLVSYVRGAWSKEEAAEENRTVATYLRKHATWSGILLRFDNLVDPPVLLARLFHLPGTSVDKADLKDMCIILREDTDLSALAPYVSKGIEARRLKREIPNEVVSTRSHKAFYTRLRRILGIGSDGALQLLHKTQSAKNLGSLDQLFRSFMLDRPKTFDRAKNATEQFGELREAHHHVVELRRQADHLRGLKETIHAYEEADRTSDELTRLQEVLAHFHRRFEVRLAEAERAGVVVRHAQAIADAKAAAQDLAQAEDGRRIAERLEIELGGGDAQLLHARLEDARTRENAARARWAHLEQELRRAGIQSEPNEAGTFAELQTVARQTLDREPEDLRPEHEVVAAHVDAKREVVRLDAELHELRRRKSNIPPRLLAVREWLCSETGLSEALLPFGGELISVLPAHAEWTGAIERVLHRFASSLLVRDEHLAQVRRLVDGRNIGTKLVFEAVPSAIQRPRPASDSRSLVNRVQTVASVYGEWAQYRISESYDIACVGSPEELDGVRRGVTQSGQVKLSERRYEKNDATRVDDRAAWILGADNEAKIELLEDQLSVARQRAADLAEQLDAAQRLRDKARSERDALHRVLEFTWESVDRESAGAAVRARQREIDEFAATSTDLAEATRRASAARSAVTECQESKQRCDSQVAVLAGELKVLDSIVHDGGAALQEALISEADDRELEGRYRGVQRKIDRHTIAAVGLRVSTALNAESKSAEMKRSRAQSHYTEKVVSFRIEWEAAALDLTAEIEDRGAYLLLLEQIEARGLPEHEQNFLRLLRDKSQDLIGHLLDDLRTAPRLVEERIDPVNTSLGRSEFDVDRFLRIRVKVRRSPEVRAFMDDLRAVVDGSWGEEDLAASEQRYAVLERLMHDLASEDFATKAWRYRVLDTREHVTFLAQEIDRAGNVMNVHDSSAGLSGGQRQKLVIFCLAAALRYQLTRDDHSVPSYGTIVLDEAFDKADSSYTRMAMDVFVEFGFHMILATPQKLLQTLEPYLGAVTSVSNPLRNQSQLAHVAMRRADS